MQYYIIYFRMSFNKFEFDTIIYTNGRLPKCISNALIINYRETKGLQATSIDKRERSKW